MDHYGIEIFFEIFRRPKKTIIETIGKDLQINELDRNKIYDRTS